jgi:hypothetical protein
MQAVPIGEVPARSRPAHEKTMPTTTTESRGSLPASALAGTMRRRIIPASRLINHSCGTCRPRGVMRASCPSWRCSNATRSKLLVHSSMKFGSASYSCMNMQQ